MSESSKANGGVGFTGMLTILFIGLKLGGIIDWPWIWVLSPLWISMLIVLWILLIILIIALIANK